MKLSRERLIQSDGAVSVLVVVLGFLVGTILVALVGKNPLNMYKAIFQALSGYNIDNGKMNIRYIGETLNYSVPFILCGLSMGFANRVGLFNIGGEGQYIMGMTIAQMVALLGPQIQGLHWVLAIVCAILIGSLWGGLVGVLKAKYEVSEVVSTIMLNYIALYLSRIISLQMPGATTYKTADFPETALITNDFFTKITNYSLLNNGIFMMIIAVIVFWFIMEKNQSRVWYAGNRIQQGSSKGQRYSGGKIHCPFHGHCRGVRWTRWWYCCTGFLQVWKGTLRYG